MLRIAMQLGLALAGLALSQAVVAQVYKCKGPGGETVYSQQPCSPQAEAVNVRTNKAASTTAGEAENRKAVFRSTDLSDAAIAERNCLASARSSIYPQLDSRLSEYQRQMARLNADAALARNNLAGATYQAGIRSQYAGLQQTIVSERQAADASMSRERQRCADERRERQAAIEKKYQSATP